MRRGVALIAVLFVTLLLEGVVVGLAMMTVSELDYAQAETDYAKAYNNAISGLTIAQVLVNTSDYDDSNHNIRLLTAYANNTPLVREPGKYEVWVEKPSGYSELWYQLHAYGYSGDVTSEIVVRVREHDYFSRWVTFCKAGVIDAYDNDIYYGRIYTKEGIAMEDIDTGETMEVEDGYAWDGTPRPAGTYPLGARFYGQVTSSSTPYDYPKSWPDEWNGDGTEEAWFAERPHWNVPEIDMPEEAHIQSLASKAREGASSVQLMSGGNVVGVLYTGPNGVSVTRTGSKKLWTYMKFVSTSGITKLRLTVKCDDGDDKPSDGDTVVTRQDTGQPINNYEIQLPNTAVIHSTDAIWQLEGELSNKMTVVSEDGPVCVTDDLVYVDADGDWAVEYNPSASGEDRFTTNPDYDGDATLGVIAARSVLLTNDNGYARNDKILIITGVLTAGASDEDADGCVRYVDWSESEYYGSIHWDTKQEALCIHGALITDGYQCHDVDNMVTAYFFRWDTWSGFAGGYRHCHIRYDERLLTEPPPHYMEVNMPLYVGWQLVR
ncbi:MAG: hypothetical protein DRP82_04885 [Planctomycetota bacterium]|nr:MAG: hypothetical protein DRP82_04885 [Planctomycetota bacterium]